MAGRRWSKARLARDLASLLGPEPPGEVSGGEVTLVRSGVVQLVSIYGAKHDPDVLHWQVAFADRKYLEMLGQPGGWVWIGIQPREDGFAWPTTRADADEALSRIVPVARRALDHVPDRSTLATLLLTPEPVSYEDYELDCHRSNLPARLVQSVILARDIPDSQVETAAMAMLGDPGVLGFRDAVGRWARDRYRGKVDVDIADLISAKD